MGLVRSEDEEIRSLEQRRKIGRPADMAASRTDLHLRVQRPEAVPRGVHLEAPDVPGRVEELAVQVRSLDAVMVEDPKVADAERREARGRRAADRPHPEDGHSSGPETLLQLLRRSTRAHGDEGEELEVPGVAVLLPGRAVRRRGGVPFLDDPPQPELLDGAGNGLRVLARMRPNERPVKGGHVPRAVHEAQEAPDRPGGIVFERPPQPVDVSGEEDLPGAKAIRAQRGLGPGASQAPPVRRVGQRGHPSTRPATARESGGAAPKSDSEEFERAEDPGSLRPARGRPVGRVPGAGLLPGREWAA